MLYMYLTSVFKIHKNNMSESCLLQKEMPMAKRKKVLPFHVWLNQVRKGVRVFEACLYL